MEVVIRIFINPQSSGSVRNMRNFRERLGRYLNWTASYARAPIVFNECGGRGRRGGCYAATLRLVKHISGENVNWTKPTASEFNTHRESIRSVSDCLIKRHNRRRMVVPLQREAASSPQNCSCCAAGNEIVEIWEAGSEADSQIS